MGKQYYRDFKTILDETSLFPYMGLCPDPEASLRHQALLEVLYCIPENDFCQLKELEDTIQWFIPDIRELGIVNPFVANNCLEEDSVDSSGASLAPYAKVIFLNPVLEKSSFDISIAVISHELAHIALKHNVMPENYDKQEDEAWDLACKWGFEKEIKKYRAMIKRRETMEELLIEKLRKVAKE